MRDEKLYLKQNILVEPLFNQWYAWPYLMSPAPAAMNIANLHLKIMQSFVNAPQVHESALKNEANYGGPFINYGASRVAETKELLEKTLHDQAHMLDLAEAIKTLDRKLADEADGYTLEPMYPAVPDILKGYVELVYDLNDQPSIRFIEGLLYKSPYYNESSQSISLSLNEKDQRPFVFSTPRLKGNGSLHLNIPFNYQGIDELFSMKYVPQSYGYIKERLGVAEKDEALFSRFFTTEQNSLSSPRYTHDDVRIRYFGHACILLETKDVSILTDPVISYKQDNGISRYTYADLPETIDYVVLTHNHQDHCIFEVLLQLRHKVKNIIVPKNNGTLADPSLKLMLKSIGFKNVSEIDELEVIEVEGGSITGLPFPGEHVDVNVRSKIAYLFQLKGRSVLCIADSNNLEPKLYEHLHDVIGDVDVLFLGMECDGAPMSWLFGPLFTKPLLRKIDQSRRFESSNYAKAIDIVNRFQPKQVYIYAMGAEPWLSFLTSIKYDEKSPRIIESNKLLEDCKSRGMVAERLFGQKEINLTLQ